MSNFTQDEEIRIRLLRRYIEAYGDMQLAASCIKKDGTKRTFVFTPDNLEQHIRGTERGQKMGATRSRNHPELMPIFDIVAGGVRTLNLATIIELRAPNGEGITFKHAAT